MIVKAILTPFSVRSRGTASRCRDFAKNRLTWSISREASCGGINSASIALLFVKNRKKTKIADWLRKCQKLVTWSSSFKTVFWPAGTLKPVMEAYPQQMSGGRIKRVGNLFVRRTKRADPSTPSRVLDFRAQSLTGRDSKNKSRPVRLWARKSRTRGALENRPKIDNLKIEKSSIFESQIPRSGICENWPSNGSFSILLRKMAFFREAKKEKGTRQRGLLRKPLCLPGFCPAKWVKSTEQGDLSAYSGANPVQYWDLPPLRGVTRLARSIYPASWGVNPSRYLDLPRSAGKSTEGVDRRFPRPASRVWPKIGTRVWGPVFALRAKTDFLFSFLAKMIVRRRLFLRLVEKGSKTAYGARSKSHFFFKNDVFGKKYQKPSFLTLFFARFSGKSDEKREPVSRVDFSGHFPMKMPRGRSTSKKPPYSRKWDFLLENLTFVSKANLDFRAKISSFTKLEILSSYFSGSF